MVDGHTSNSEQRFLDGVSAWFDGDRQWPGYWLDAPCCLLEHARQTGCCFDPPALDALDRLASADHERAARVCYGLFLPPGLDRNQSDAPISQAASLMAGLVAGVQAARALVGADPQPRSSPARDFAGTSFAAAAVACCQAYQRAWPPGATTTCA